MKKQILDFKNYVLHIFPSESKKEKAIVLFHGFPSESFNGTDQEKNKDLLRYLCESTGFEGYLHHYNGLGRSNQGQFSFLDSINDSIELLELIQTRHKDIILIGHSWGGWVAMNCFNNSKLSIKQLILLSPLNTLPNSETLTSIMEAVKKDFPHITKTKSILELVEELELISLNLHPRECVNTIVSKSKVYILQANDDQEVPQQTTNEFQKLFKCNCTYEIMDTDHSFSKNRYEMFNKCMNFIKNNV